MIGTMFSLVRRRQPEPEVAPPPAPPPEPPVAEMPRRPHWQNYTREALMQLRSEDEQSSMHRRPTQVVALFGHGIPPTPGIGKVRLVPGTYRVRATNEAIRVYDAKGEELGINSSGCFLVTPARIHRTKYDSDGGLAEITFRHGKGTFLISRTGGEAD